MKKNISAILVGLWTSWMLALHLNHGLKQAFGINVNLAYSEHASIYDNIVLFISGFICFAFGVFIACYIKKEKYWFVGIVTLFCNISIVIVLLIIGIIIKAAPLWLYSLMVVELIAGLSGIFIYKYLKEDSAVYLDNEVFEYIDYYFAPRMRSLFTIILFFTAVYALVINTPAIILFFKWFFIAPIYILMHPGLWVSQLFWDTGQFIISPTFLIIVPFIFIHLVYKIGISNRNKIKKIIFPLLLFLAFNLVNAISISMVRAPVERSITHFASSGAKVWDILFDKQTRPLAKEIRYKYLIEEGKLYEAQQILDEAINGYFELAYVALKGENINLAEHSIGKINELSESEEHLEDIGLLYLDFEFYNKAYEIFEKLYKENPKDLDVIGYLITCYDELGMYQELLPLVIKLFEFKKDELTEREKQEILNYIADVEDMI